VEIKIHLLWWLLKFRALIAYLIYIFYITLQLYFETTFLIYQHMIVFSIKLFIKHK